MREAVIVCVLAALAGFATPASAQTRPAEPARVAPADEIKLDESSALRAVAIESRMAALRANFQLMLRQVQDLQNEYNKALEERKKLLDDAGRRARVDVRDATEWGYDEAGQRYVRSRKNP